MIDAALAEELKGSLNTIGALAEGINPFSGEVLSSDTFWLVGSGVLEFRVGDFGGKRKYVTEAGERIGFNTEMRSSERGAYPVTLINPKGQRFIIENIEHIISGSPVSISATEAE